MNRTPPIDDGDDGPTAVKEGESLGAETIGQFFAGEWRWFKTVWLLAAVMLLVILIVRLT
jgi:hypothetical protein